MDGRMLRVAVGRLIVALWSVEVFWFGASAMVSRVISYRLVVWVVPGAGLAAADGCRAGGAQGDARWGLGIVEGLRGGTGSALGNCPAKRYQLNACRDVCFWNCIT